MKKAILILLVLLTGNTKSQWTQYPSGSFGESLNFVQFITNARGFLGGNCMVSGQSVIFETYDGGPSGVVHSTYTTLTFYDFYYFNSSNVFLGGSQKSVLKSSNGGGFWQVKTCDTGSMGNFYSLSNPSLSIGYVVGDSPNNVYKSKNGGENWWPITSPANVTLKGVYFVNSVTGWVSGQNGALYKTTTGGSTWIRQNQSSSYNLEKVFFIDSVTGIVVGSGGIIFKTTNGGANWILKQSTITSNLRGVCFYSPNLFWAAGAAGKIIKSTDVGETWFQQNTNNANVTFNDIFFPSVDTGYAVASGGVMYRTTNSGGGLVGIINNQKPLKFELKQNFPNPFNPVTQIEYSLLKAGEVNITVYNLIGETVSILVNEFQNYGTYRINFDGSNLASGAYYYKLTSGEFTETKKMILIK